MNAVVEFVIFIAFIVLFFIITLDSVRLRFKNYKLNKEIEQYALNYIILSEKIDQMIKKEDNKSVEETDGFLKFVTESREWAFQYIEDVQKAMTALEKAASEVPIMPQSYLTSEELEDLRKAIAEVLRQLPEKPQND